MSLGIAFKGPEGIVLAADSRVTLGAEIRQGTNVERIHSSFDNATKLLRVSSQRFIGVVTYGLGALGQTAPRTAHSFMPEFEDELATEAAELAESDRRLSVEDFAQKLADFFMRQWSASMPTNYSGPDMVFLVGGYDKDAPYGRVFEIYIPRNPVARETMAGQDVFGLSWGGQRELTDRVLQGFDPNLPKIIQAQFKLTDDQRDALETQLKRELALRVPYQFLPLQDCVDLSMTLIRTTIAFQTWMVGIRGVGGAIDVATITRTDGFASVQQKTITGERGAI